MVKLPDATDLGVRNPRAVRGQPDYPMNSPIGDALQRLGGTVANAGFRLAAEEKQKAEKTQALGVESRMLQFEDQWMTAAVDRVNGAKPGAAGFTDAMRADYLKSARQFGTTVPEELRPVYEMKLFELESRLTQKAQTFEREEADRYSRTQVADGHNVLLNRQAADPDAWQSVEQDGEALIRNRPGASPIETDEEVRAWRQRRALQLFETRRAQSEASERGRLGVATPSGSVVDRIIGVESGGNPNAKNPNSSAEGLGQFIDSTWLSTVRQHRPDIAAGKSAAEIIALKRDRALAREMTAAHTADNMEYLRNRGVPVTAGNTYLAHFAGAAGAVQVIKADPNASVASVLGQDKVAANPFLAGKSVAWLQAWADKKMGGASDPTSILSDPAPEYAALPFETRMRLFEQSLADEKRKQEEGKAQTRFDIGVAETNAPAAFQQTGSYQGAMPTMDQYIVAYGEREGVKRYDEFTASVDTAQQVFRLQAAPADEIAETVQAARPVSSGDNAALEQKRYQALSSAADAVLKAREADPAGYVARTFPSVATAFEEAQQSKDYAPAIRMSIEAQQQLGVQNIQPLPKPVVTAAVDLFKDVTLGEADRIAAISGPVMSAKEPEFQQAVFNQMVEGGLPDTTQGAMEALARGDDAAARRLFQAAIVDISALPGKAPNTPAQIDEAIQSALLDEGQIGDIYYGLSDGTVENFERAQRDSKLLNNAVNIRIRRGETLEAAVAAAAKDLYGDVKPVTGDSRVNAQILLPADQDEAAVLEGLAGVLPQVETALTEALAVPSYAPTADSTRAILDATGKNYIANVIAEGYFRNAGQGFVFIDPFTGTAVPDKNGQAMIFSLDQVEASRPLAPPMILPSDQPRTLNENVQGEMQQQEDRVRQMYKGTAPAVDPDGFPIDLGRVKIQNEDGSFSTEETTTVEIDGRWVNVPTIWDGKRLNEDAAVDRARAEIARGAIFPNYDTLKDAEAGARRRSDYLGKLREAK